MLSDIAAERHQAGAIEHHQIVRPAGIPSWKVLASEKVDLVAHLVLLGSQPVPVCTILRPTRRRGYVDPRWPSRAGLGVPAIGSATTTAPSTGAPLASTTVTESDEGAEIACGTAKTVQAVT
jgi:hypothetical protein